jgi:hypothetical protein
MRHPALQNMKFLEEISTLWVIFDLLFDPDSEYGSRSTVLIEPGNSEGTF